MTVVRSRIRFSPYWHSFVPHLQARMTIHAHCHTYADQASILKFIAWNWVLTPLSARSRDNLPNPAALPINPFVPSNCPAIDDLRSIFDFTHPRTDTPLILPGGI
jgi:hypothetical protein